MSLQYSGGTLINNVFTPATRQAWVTAVTDALAFGTPNAGWSVISGTQGSADIKLECAANNVGAKARFRFLEPGSGNCAQVTLKNVAETMTSSTAFALPTAGGGQWRIIANKFHFFAFATGSANVSIARGVVMGGTLYTPTFWSPPTSTLGWHFWISPSDTDATNGRPTFRQQLRRFPAGNAASFGAITGANQVDALQSTAAGMPSISPWQGGASSDDNSYRWEDNTLPIYEPLMSWAFGTAIANEAKIKGQLYDACVINGFWNGEQTLSFDGVNWMVITHGPAAGNSQTAVLALAIP